MLVEKPTVDVQVTTLERVEAVLREAGEPVSRNYIHERLKALKAGTTPARRSGSIRTTTQRTPPSNRPPMRGRSHSRGFGASDLASRLRAARHEIIVANLVAVEIRLHRGKVIVPEFLQRGRVGFE